MPKPRRSRRTRSCGRGARYRASSAARGSSLGSTGSASTRPNGGWGGARGRARGARNGAAPAERAETQELRPALERALGELPVDLRAPVVLRDIEGLSTAEAASVLKLGEAAFKSRLHRGRMALRGLLTPWIVTSDL